MFTDVDALFLSTAPWNTTHYITHRAYACLTDDQVYWVPLRDGFWGRNPIYLLLPLFSPGDKEIEDERERKKIRGRGRGRAGCAKISNLLQTGRLVSITYIYLTERKQGERNKREKILVALLLCSILAQNTYMKHPQSNSSRSWIVLWIFKWCHCWHNHPSFVCKLASLLVTPYSQNPEMFASCYQHFDIMAKSWQ